MLKSSHCQKQAWFGSDIYIYNVSTSNYGKQGYDITCKVVNPTQPSRNVYYMYYTSSVKQVQKRPWTNTCLSVCLNAPNMIHLSHFLHASMQNTYACHGNRLLPWQQLSHRRHHQSSWCCPKPGVDPMGLHGWSTYLPQKYGLIKGLLIIGFL